MKIVARELGQIAKLIAGGNSMIDTLAGTNMEREVVSLKNKVDKTTYILAVKVYKELKKRLVIEANVNEALGRLKYAGDSKNEAQIRNNIFKAAHALGIKLPHSSF